MAKSNQIKQIWLKPEDDENIERIADYLRSMGIDVEPDNRRAKEPFSHTKVIRWLASNFAATLKD